jgi:hypothetical protein
MLITQSEKFQNFEFESLAGIVSNTWQTKIGEIKITVKITAPVRLVPVAMLIDDAAVEPSPLYPDPSREKGRRGGGQHPGPPLSSSPACCTSPTIVTSPEPTHSTPRPRQHPSSTRARPSRPVSPVHVASMPCAGHLLGAPVPDAPAYKSPRRSNDWTHTIPSYLPDTLTSPRSL